MTSPLTRSATRSTNRQKAKRIKKYVGFTTLAAILIGVAVAVVVVRRRVVDVRGLVVSAVGGIG